MTGAHRTKSTLSYKSPRAPRRWRAFPTQGFGLWLLARQLAHGSAALVLHDAEEEHVFTRTATRDNGTQWNPGERVTDSEYWQGLTWDSSTP